MITVTVAAFTNDDVIGRYDARAASVRAAHKLAGSLLRYAAQRHPTRSLAVAVGGDIERRTARRIRQSVATARYDVMCRMRALSAVAASIRAA